MIFLLLRWSVGTGRSSKTGKSSEVSNIVTPSQVWRKDLAERQELLKHCLKLGIGGRRTSIVDFAIEILIWSKWPEVCGMVVNEVKNWLWSCKGGRCNVPCSYVYRDYGACMASLISNLIVISHNPWCVYLFMVQFRSVTASALQMNGQCSFHKCGCKLWPEACCSFWCFIFPSLTWKTRHSQIFSFIFILLPLHKQLLNLHWFVLLCFDFFQFPSDYRCRSELWKRRWN